MADMCKNIGNNMIAIAFYRILTEAVQSSDINSLAQRLEMRETAGLALFSCNKIHPSAF